MLLQRSYLCIYLPMDSNHRKLHPKNSRHQVEVLQIRKYHCTSYPHCNEQPLRHLSSRCPRHTLCCPPATSLKDRAAEVTPLGPAPSEDPQSQTASGSRKGLSLRGLQSECDWHPDPCAHPQASHSLGFVLKGDAFLSDDDKQACEIEGPERTGGPSLSA